MRTDAGLGMNLHHAAVTNSGLGDLPRPAVLCATEAELNPLSARAVNRREVVDVGSLSRERGILTKLPTLAALVRSHLHVAPR